MANAPQGWYERRAEFFRSRYYGNPHPVDPLLGANGFERLPLDAWTALTVAVGPAHDVLDPACGNGLLLRFIWRSDPSRRRLWGSDFLGESIETARTIVLCDAPARLAVANAADGPAFPGACFDAILFDPSHVHANNRRTAVASFCAALRPKGCLIFYDYDGRGWQAEEVRQWLPNTGDWSLSVRSYAPVAIVTAVGHPAP